MSTSSIPPVPANYGVGRLNSNNQRRQQGKPFEEALENEAAAEAAETADSEETTATRPLQPEAPVIRRDSQDGRHHIDVIA
ncbi:MAG: hypothetical protein ACYTG5_15205 [Planctomycetota bacterium]|jgi:hypothetical protein